eukprot:CAMPEP_0184510226 /NCGR_PEP_ID=MMETSP0198_2-20121128/1700_1 /TAXON_ID=1112570 /ORGANISM="Thraustochytrium sp., Strain LLF1b" /LENGTH=99 /DNA_ID=CAMNT_0026900101 /DNA_START=220 /DNA_END=519 /DNA_ORIENTATION=-
MASFRNISVKDMMDRGYAISTCASLSAVAVVVETYFFALAMAQMKDVSTWSLGLAWTLVSISQLSAGLWEGKPPRLLFISALDACLTNFVTFFLLDKLL